jgi:hypothetical protein
VSFDVSRLADHELVDSDGESHRLGDRWSEHRAIVLFLRHFG